MYYSYKTEYLSSISFRILYIYFYCAVKLLIKNIYIYIKGAKSEIDVSTLYSGFSEYIKLECSQNRITLNTPMCV